MAETTKMITLEDCDELEKVFDTFFNTITNHDLKLMALIIKMKMNSSFNLVRAWGEIIDQENMKEIFSLVINFIETCKKCPS